MTTRRDLLALAALAPLAPLLAACGGGSSAADGRLTEVHRVVPTDIAPDDWPTATPDSAGISPAVMHSFLQSGNDSAFLRSLLVVRNGVLVGERYYNGSRSSDLLEVESVTKTVTGLLIGIALRDGKLTSTAQTLGQLLPRQLANKPGSAAAAVTVRQVLMMESGLAWNEATQDALLNTPDLTALALGLAADTAPGSRWNYSSAVSHLLSPVLAGLYGMNEAAMATRYLFEPLGIKQSYWVLDAVGDNIGSFGLHLRTRDLMKIGWMSMQGGQWDGKSVVPAAWLAESQSNLMRVPLADYGVLSNRGYGNLWWTGAMGGRDVILGWGFGGQFMVLVPSLNMVVATAANTAHVSVDAAARQESAILALIGQFLSAV